METAPQVPTWLAAGVAVAAVYAAILSTVQFVRSLRDEQPRVKVSLRLGRILNVPGDEAEKLFVTYVNVGKIPVTIPSLPGIRLSCFKGKKLVLHNSKYPLPYRLEPYAENESWVNLNSLSQYIDWNHLGKGAEYWLTGVVTDASGKKHESRPHVLFRPKRPEQEIELGPAMAANE